MPAIRGLVALIAGRWQIPAALAAVLALALAVNALRERPPEVDFDALLADLQVLRTGKAYPDVANSIANLLLMRPPLPERQQARLHEMLSDVIYEQELLRSAPIKENVALILEHAEAAAKLRLEPTPAALLRVAEAHNWLQHRQEAMNAYQRVLDHAPSGLERRAALRALVRLMDGWPSLETQRRDALAELLSEEGVSPAYLWWGVQNAIQDALDHNDLGRAQNVLIRHGAAFKRSDLRGYGDYLQAWVLINQERHLEAEPLVRAVDAWLTERLVGDSDMDRAGFLPSLNRVLRGYVELAEHRPQVALDHFDQAIGLDARGDGFVAAVIGRTEALAALERHDTAWKTAQDAVAALQSHRETALSGIPRLARAMQRIFRKREEKGDYVAATGYLKLALELTPHTELESRRDLHRKLADINIRAAEANADHALAIPYHRAAALNFERASLLCMDDVEGRANLLWSAITQNDLGGNLADARRLLTQFVDLRAEDPRLPAALLRLAQSCEAGGLLDDAEHWYRELEQRFPVLAEAARARLLRAQMLLAQRDDGAAEAEALLLSLLEADTISPEAKVFRDALFTLGDLQYEQGRYALAIRRLEDFLALYPEDSQAEHVRFWLANAYRRSAYELRDPAPDGTSNARREQEGRERFRIAAALFQNVVGEKNNPPDGHLGPEYLRLALFYLADCLFELNEPASLQSALTVYRQAAARYQNQPSALIAQIQIANIHLRQGQITEAARAVENARWLLRGVPDQLLDADGPANSRARWEAYLNAVAGSHLFREVFADNN